MKLLSCPICLIQKLQNNGEVLLSVNIFFFYQFMCIFDITKLFLFTEAVCFFQAVLNTLDFATVPDNNHVSHILMVN